MSNLNVVDYTLIISYFIVLLGLGFYLRARANKSMEDYFLAGRSLPWWALGLSGTAAWFSVSGTMVIIAFLYMLGPRGLYI
nr:sodium:solute symporter [Bacteroidota bacterium]